MGIDYTAAGVNIAAGNLAVEKIKESVASTHSPQVLAGLGSFGSFYDLGEVIRDYTRPVMVQSIDGVGTKIMVASMMGSYATIGRDLLSACANDIVVHGARPLTFLDYIANDRLDPDVVAEIVQGMTDGCREEGISLVGGETAEMPGTYMPGEHDLVGIITGVVEYDRIIKGDDVVPGDIILGVASSGLHTNGFSLARKVLFDIGGFSVDDLLEGDGQGPDDESGRVGPRTIGQVLLEPHVNYTTSVHKMLAAGVTVKSMAHITGGGLIENVPRVLPKDVSAWFDPTAWPIPAIFHLIGRTGEVDRLEMFRALNMGIGLTVVVPAQERDSALRIMREVFTVPVYEVGVIQAGDGRTRIAGVTPEPGSSTDPSERS